MPTTTRQALRYPQATDASAALWTYWENLAKDVDGKAGMRGVGTALPTTNRVVGDRYYHNTYRCFIVWDGASWRQDSIAIVASDSDRTSYAAAVSGAGLAFHNGFQVFQADTNQLWNATGGGVTLVNVPTYRGTGSAFPASVQEGDTYYHNLYRCTVRREQGAWRQVTTAYATSDADRAAFLTGLSGAGLTMHNSFRLFQTDTNVLWLSTGSTTLAPWFGGDTGALEFTMASGWTKVVGRLQMRGGWVNITIQATKASWTAGNLLTTISAAYRPGNNQWPTGRYQGATYEVGISTAGNITVNDAGTGGIVVSHSYPAG